MMAGYYRFAGYGQDLSKYNLKIKCDGY